MNGVQSLFWNILSIGLGGALGTLFRYFLNVNMVFVSLPMVTVIENVLGSLLLGAFTGWLLHKQVKEWLKLGLGVGFCGGFTTMSTLAADSLFLVNHFSFVQAGLYVSVSLFGGIIFAFIGLLVGQRWSGLVIQAKSNS